MTPRRLLPTALLLAACSSAPVDALGAGAPRGAGEPLDDVRRVPAPARVERRVGAMGTLLTVQIRAESRDVALRASEAAIRAIEASEARLSTWNDASELARLNRHPVGEPFELSPELAEELSTARAWWRETRGAFDPGVGALVRAWGLRTGGRVPGADELRAARAASGLDRLDRRTPSTASRLVPDVAIEEGGFGKGAGLDRAARAALDAGAHRGALDLGGQVAFLRAADDGAPFAWSVADPRDRGRIVARLEVDGGSLATSGNSERGILVGGVRYGHLIDPRTGEPAPDFGSLTVHARSALDADCLSTGLYVMGPDAALTFAAEREGLEVLVLQTTPDGGLRARATPGLRVRFLIPELTIETVRPGGHEGTGS